MTLNHYYADNLKKCQTQRLRQRLGPAPSWTGDGEEPLVRLNDTFKAYTSNEEHSAEAIHDALKSYYKVARKRFVDAVLTQAMGYHLITSSKAPLWKFSPEFVSTLKDDVLSRFVAEPVQRLEKRKVLAAEIGRLEKGMVFIGWN